MEKLVGLKDRFKADNSAVIESILVVDDCADLLELQKLILELEGYEVTTALGGRVALELLSNITKPDLILLDVQMAGMSGPEFLTVFKERYPDLSNSVPVVFLSGMDDIPNKNVVGYIHKPFEVNGFLESVRRFIERGIIERGRQAFCSGITAI